jgi:tetratricopeptide (TPR) repeat protein
VRFTCRRGIALAAWTAACGTAAWLALTAHRADLDVERALADGRRPTAAALSQAAARRAAAAVEALADLGADPSERLWRYREQLEASARLLVAGLSSRPTDAFAWVRLAAVDSELDHGDGARLSALMSGAEALVPHRADLQQALGELALDLGRTHDGLAHLRRAVALDASTGRTTIEALSRRGFSPAEVAGVVPREPRHLVALAAIYQGERQEPAYIELVEPVLLRERDVPLLAVWSNAHRRIGEWRRLERALDALADDAVGPFAIQVRLERSRARLALGRAAGALEDATAAWTAEPSSTVAAELVGVAALAAGEPARALEGFQAALRSGARGSADARTRARLYRGVGQAEEARARIDLAYEAYRRALELDPAEPLARARLLEIERRAAAR